MQRLHVKAMLREWERAFPGRIESIFSGIRNLAPSQLADPACFDFAGLEARRRPASALADADEVDLDAVADADFGVDLGGVVEAEPPV
jgi:tRNA 2-thiocytidine biosynthesis protein TtcA